MLRTIEAIIEPDGQVRLLEPISVSGARRALVTVLDEPAESTALLSEPALAADWNRPEEEAAWQHLQGAA
ncbi:MAG TPA: hypothetical protein VFS20_16575 [Longimicrobium sp.]|nr:hypothetical protein [Longimicrobium sp.]